MNDNDELLLSIGVKYDLESLAKQQAILDKRILELREQATEKLSHIKIDLDERQINTVVDKFVKQMQNAGDKAGRAMTEAFEKASKPKLNFGGFNKKVKDELAEIDKNYSKWISGINKKLASKKILNNSNFLSSQKTIKKVIEDTYKTGTEELNKYYKALESKSKTQAMEKVWRDRNDSMLDAAAKRYKNAETIRERDLKAEADALTLQAKLQLQESNKQVATLKQSLKKKHNLRKTWINKIREIEHKLSTETRAIHKRAYQEQIKLLKQGTIATEAEYRKRLHAIDKIQGEANEKQRELSRSWRGVFDKNTGTTFTHKALTTAQYMAAASAMYGVVNAMGATVRAVVEADTALKSFQAILELNTKDAKKLQDTVYNTAITFGGTTEELNRVALALGRAGLKGKILAEGLKIVSQAALISGDNIDNITEMFSAWKTVYPKEELTHLSDVMVKVANESLASIDGFKTMTSYMLTVGKQAGLTADSLIALAGAWKNTGKADSIAATEIRRLFKQIANGSVEVRKAYAAMGIDLTKVNENLQKGGKHAEETFSKFMETMSKHSGSDEFKKALGEITSTLDKQTISTLVQVATSKSGYKEMVKAAKNAAGSTEEASKKMAVSYSRVFDRLVAAAKKSAVSFESSFVKSITNGVDTTKKLNGTIETFSDDINGFMSNLGEYTADVLKVVGDLTEAYIVYKGVVATGAILETLTSQYRMLRKLKKAQIEFNIAVSKNPYVLAGVAIATTVVTISEAFDKLNEIAIKGVKEVKKNADAMDWSSKGYKFNSKAETIAEEVQSHYDNMERYHKQYTKFLNDNNIKVANIYKASYKNEKKLYEDKLKALNDYLGIKKNLEGKSTSNASSNINIITNKPFINIDEYKHNKIMLELQDKINRVNKTAKDIELSKLDTIKKEREYVLSTYEGKERTKALYKLDEDRLRVILEYTKAINKENKAVQQAYSKYIKIVGTEEQKFQDKLAQQMSALGESGVLTAEQLKNAFNKLNSDHQISLTITGLNDAQNSMTSMLDSQIALAESGMNWGNSLTGVAKQLENVSKATTKLYVDKLKYEKADTKLQTEYAEKFLKANGNELKQKHIMKEFDDKEHKLNITRKQAEINGYASLAGAIGEAFSKGSAAAEAFQAIQAGLGIVNGITSITGAWASAPFPANLPAVAVTTASVIPLIAQLSSLGGSSGSGGSSSGGSFANVTDNYSTKLDDMNKPIIDRLDKQISLLQTISQRGTAGRVGVLKSHNEFALEMKKDAVDAVKTYFTNPTTGNVNNQVYADSTTQKMFTNSGINIPATNEKVDSGYDTYTVQYYKLQDVLNASTKDILSTAKTLKVFYDNSKASSTMYENTKKNIEKLQQTIYGFANNLSGSINDILDAGKDFKNLFDSITMSTTYATKDLAKAQEQVNSLKGKDSLTDYLQKQISAIDSLQSKYGTNVQQLLLSSNPADIVKQTQALEDLEYATNQTFNNGVEDALNYLDSINIVGKAMATSNKNIKSYKDSFKTQSQLANDMMSKFTKHTEKLATSYSELDKIYQRMSTDANGLTDAELEALNANKKLIESSDNLKKAWLTRNETEQETVNRLIKEAGLRTTLTDVSKTNEKAYRAEIDAIYKKATADGFLTQAESDAINAADKLANSTWGVTKATEVLVQGLTKTQISLINFKDSIGSIYGEHVKLDKALELTGASIPTTREQLVSLYNTFNKTNGIDEFEQSILDAGKAALQSAEDNKKTLQTRKEDLFAITDVQKLELSRKRELAKYTDKSNIALLKSIYTEQDRQKAIQKTTDTINKSISTITSSLDNFKSNLNTIKDLRSGISENIRVLSGNRYTKDDITSGIFALNNMKTDDQSKQVTLVEKMMSEYYADQKDLLQKQYDAMVKSNNIAQDNARKSAQAQNDSINAFNSINSSIKGLKDFAYNYRVSANPQLANNEFYKNFALLQSAIGSNNSSLVSSLSSTVQSNASTYLGTLSTSSLSANDRHEANKILASLDSLPKREDKTLVDVDASVNRATSQIGSFEDTFSAELARLKEEQTNMYSSMDTILQHSETSIVGEIANLTQEVKNLKAELATIATNTAKTASSTATTADNTKKPILEVA